ncbi:hypothetical protein ACHAWT_002726 [Skeletonema menzelii]
MVAINILGCITLSLWTGLSYSFAPRPTIQRMKLNFQLSAQNAEDDGIIPPLFHSRQSISRADLFEYSSRIVGLSLILPGAAHAKCTDIESCREEGERKIEADLKLNPIMRLSDGVNYRVLRPSALPGPKVKDGSSIELIYSISTASGQYMYSKGFGFEKVNFGGKLQSDLGLDSMRVVVGEHNVPVGIESALIGMGRGERRRVELPPGVGFETSNWQPSPTSRRGITQIEQYKKKLVGFGSQPAFPAETVWDIEVLGIRN